MLRFIKPLTITMLLLAFAFSPLIGSIFLTLTVSEAHSSNEYWNVAPWLWMIGLFWCWPTILLTAIGLAIYFIVKERREKRRPQAPA